jgi:hypothetical protein
MSRHDASFIERARPVFRFARILANYIQLQLIHEGIPPMKQPKPKKHYEKPLSLAPLSFTEAIKRIAKAKPVPKKTPKKD